MRVAVLGLVEGDRAPAGALGLVHGRVGVLEEHVGVGRVLRVQGDSRSSADVESRLGDLEGLVERRGDPLPATRSLVAISSPPVTTAGTRRRPGGPGSSLLA